MARRCHSQGAEAKLQTRKRKKLQTRKREKRGKCGIPAPLRLVLLTIGSVCSGLNIEKYALAFLLGGGYALVDEAFACDCHVPAKAYALANFPRLRNFFDDCCSRDFYADAPAVDVLVAGFPCQPFSAAGKQQGFEDTKGRGRIFFSVLEYI